MGRGAARCCASAAAKSVTVLERVPVDSRFPMVEFDTSWEGHAEAKFRGYDTWRRHNNWHYIEGRTGTGS
jgi:hypothetical protein